MVSTFCNRALSLCACVCLSVCPYMQYVHKECICIPVIIITLFMYPLSSMCYVSTIQYVLCIHYPVCVIYPLSSMCYVSTIQYVLCIHYPVCAMYPLSSMCYVSTIQYVLCIHYPVCAMYPLSSMCYVSTIQYVLCIHYPVCVMYPLSSMCYFEGKVNHATHAIRTRGIYLYDNNFFFLRQRWRLFSKIIGTFRSFSSVTYRE